MVKLHVIVSEAKWQWFPAYQQCCKTELLRISPAVNASIAWERRRVRSRQEIGTVVRHSLDSPFQKLRPRLQSVLSDRQRNLDDVVVESGAKV
jgi:hypothetical protein